MINYAWTILRLRSVPGDPSLLRDIFWKLSADDGAHSAQMDGSFSLTQPEPVEGISQADLIRIVEREISSVDVERNAMGKSTQPDGFDGNALELYRHKLARELERLAKPKPMELAIPA